ncbi:MAG: ribosome maturation factor RimP [Pseudobdellovibrionaceae bacterium]
MSETPSWMEKVEKMANEVAAQEGCIIYDLEFVGFGKGRVLRIFIDREDGNVTIDDCSNVSKGLNLRLDEEDVIPGEAYHLEVSTPGVDRHLKKPWHFQKTIGKKVYIKLSRSLESVGVTDKKWKSAKTVEHVLESADDSGIRFLIEGMEINIPYSLIEKAKVLFEFTKGQKK